MGLGTTEVYTVSISGRSTIRSGFSRTYTATLKDGSGNEVTGNWEWSYDFNNPKIITFTPTDNKVVVLVEDEDEEHLGEIIILIAHETTHDISASIEVTIDSLL